MQTFYGSLVGAVKMLNPSHLVPMAYEHTSDHILVRDRLLLAGGVAGDQIFLERLGWETVLDPISTIWFDALGAGVTLSVGDVTFPAGLAPPAAAAAAGNMKVLGGLFISKYFLPLWQQLGYADLKAAKKIGDQCNLIATLAGAAAAGNVVWQLQGQQRI